VAYASRDIPVFVPARELARIGTRRRVRSTISIALKCNRGHGDVRCFSEPFFQIVILRFTVSQPKPPAVVVYHDADMIRVVQGRGATLERGIIEIPSWGGGLPDEPGKLAPVFLVASPSALGSKV